jgi:Protein of unknown function (DUF3551)
MRIVLIGLATLTIALPIATDLAYAQREPRPWCLQAGRGGPGGGLLDCTYHTLQQCRAAMGGGTDGCTQNPALAWDRIEGKRSRPAPSTTGRGY